MMHLVAKKFDGVQADRGKLRRWVVALVTLIGGEWAGSRRVSKRRMRLIETLPLGGKKQLLLVSCDGESFLIGTGAESVQSILRVRSAQEPRIQIAKEIL